MLEWYLGNGAGKERWEAGVRGVHVYVDSVGFHMVFFSSQHRNMAELELVAEYAPDRINEANHGQTPLHCAASYDHEAAVGFLLSAGANVNQIDKYGRTPVSYTTGKSARLRQLLIDAGGTY